MLSLRPFALAALVAMTSTALADAPPAVLHADTLGDRVRLMWLPNHFPPDLVGFHLRRAVRVGGSVTGWTDVSQQPHRPTITGQRHWPDVHFERLAIVRLKSLVGLSRQTGVFRADDDAAMLSMLRAATPEQIAAFRGAFFYSPDYALATGFGAVVKGPFAPNTVFGLFGVRASGAVDPQPMSVAESVRLLPGDPRLRLEPTIEPIPNGGVRLTFGKTAEEARRLGVHRWEVFRNGASLGSPLPHRTDDGIRVILTDIEAVNEAPHRYEIATVNVFGREVGRDRYDYAPPANPKPPERPILQASLALGGGVALAWTVDPRHAASARFDLTRRRLPDAQWQVIAHGLESDARGFVDTDPGLEPGTAYTYRVTVRPDTGAPLVSPGVTIFFADTRVPPPPTGLTAAWHRNHAGERVVRLAWDEPAPSDNVTAFYVFDADLRVPGAVARQSGFAPIRGQTFDVPLQNRDARPMEFRLYAASANGVESAPATVRLDVPGTHLPTVDFDVLEVTEDGTRIRATWSTDLPDLTGFRVRIGETSKTVDGGQRAWTSGPQKPGSVHTLSLVAVARSGLESQPGPQRSIRIPARRGAPPRPSGLRLLERPTHLDLVWDRPRQADRDTWDLQIERATGESWVALGQVRADAPPTFRIHAPEPPPQRYRLTPRTLQSVRGPAAQVTHEPPTAPPTSQTKPPTPTAEEVPPPEPKRAPWWPWLVGLLGGSLTLGALLRYAGR